MARQATYAVRLLRPAAPVCADMLDATEPEARIAPDPDESDHALLLLMKRVGVDAGRDLWNTLVCRQKDFHGSRPALISAYNGKPSRQAWLFLFKVTPRRAVQTRQTPVRNSILVSMVCWRALARLYGIADPNILRKRVAYKSHS